MFGPAGSPVCLYLETTDGFLPFICKETLQMKTFEGEGQGRAQSLLNFPSLF